MQSLRKCEISYLGLFGKATHNLHDVVGKIKVDVELQRLTDDVAASLSAGRVDERT